MLRQREAQEIIRKKQQGHGRPIISVEFQGQRLVAVGNRMVASPHWRFFADFLLHNLKVVMGLKWGHDAQKAGLDHPLFRWLRKMNDYQKLHDTMGAPRPIGYVSSFFQFAYALYLMEHNDQLPKSLISRLRQPSHFFPAAYETLVAAAFALAGAKIKDAVAKSDKAPEFWATMSSGRTYAVEAKRKNAWKNAYDLKSDAFKRELRSWLRDKIYDASAKNLLHAVYWFELSIGSEIPSGEQLELQALIQGYIREAESITVGKKANGLSVPAYVFVTNHTHFADEEDLTIQRMMVLEGFRIDDFRTEDFVSLEEAMERRDNHRDMIWVYQCFLEVEAVPSTFDGTPPGIGETAETLRIGKTLRYRRADGSAAEGKIEDIVAPLGNAAMVIVKNAVGEERVMLQVPLTTEEARAAAVYGAAVFGKPEGPFRDYRDDVFGIYDRFLEIFSSYPRESLVSLLQGHPDYEELSGLDSGKLRIRAAREFTKSAAAPSPTCRP